MRKNRLLTRIVCLLMASAGWSFTAPEEGQRLFSFNCAACHGLDGHGGEHAPDIATVSKIRAMSEGQLSKVLQNGIPAAGMPAFGATFSPEQIESVIHYLRILQNQQVRLSLRGNPKHGGEIFFRDSSCAACHLMNGAGGFIGPDLTSFGKIHSDAEIRQAIIEPNKSVDWRHPFAEVHAGSGRILKGIIRNEDNFSLQLQTLDGSFQFLNKADVVSVKRNTESLMPKDYASELSKTDLDDLIAYLITNATGTPSEDVKDDDN